MTELYLKRTQARLAELEIKTRMLEDALKRSGYVTCQCCGAMAKQELITIGSYQAMKQPSHLELHGLHWCADCLANNEELCDSKKFLDALGEDPLKIALSIRGYANVFANSWQVLTRNIPVIAAQIVEDEDDRAKRGRPRSLSFASYPLATVFEMLLEILGGRGLAEDVVDALGRLGGRLRCLPFAWEQQPRWNHSTACYLPLHQHNALNQACSDLRIKSEKQATQAAQ